MEQALSKIREEGERTEIETIAAIEMRIAIAATMEIIREITTIHPARAIGAGIGNRTIGSRTAKSRFCSITETKIKISTTETLFHLLP